MEGAVASSARLGVKPWPPWRHGTRPAPGWQSRPKTRTADDIGRYAGYIYIYILGILYVMVYFSDFHIIGIFWIYYDLVYSIWMHTYSSVWSSSWNFPICYFCCRGLEPHLKQGTAEIYVQIQVDSMWPPTHTHTQIHIFSNAHVRLVGETHTHTKANGHIFSIYAYCKNIKVSHTHTHIHTHIHLYIIYI